MTTLAAKSSLSDYFTQEIQSETRNEYIDGVIIPMTGGTPTHNRIVGNLFASLYGGLQNQPYSVFFTDQRLWIPAASIATYPDLMVFADPIIYQEGRQDTLVNPILIAEVLSPSTAAYDRSGKFASYRTIDSFKEYLLIAQERMYVEHFQKEGDRWIFSAYEGEAIVDLMTLEVAIAITQLYSRVNFDDKKLK